MTDNVDVVRGLYECFQRGDIQGALERFDEGCEVEFIGPKSIPFAGSYRGAEGMGKALEKFTGSSEILEFGPDEFHAAEGDFVTVLGHEHCRSKATGREWKTPLVETFVLQDGKIQKFRCMYDTAAVANAFAG
jgi:ketosteroid isomerase-like protein